MFKNYSQQKYGNAAKKSAFKGEGVKMCVQEISEVMQYAHENEPDKERARLSIIGAMIAAIELTRAERNLDISKVG